MKTPADTPNAGEIMVPAVVSVSPNTPLSSVLGKMRDHEIYEVPVMKKDRLLGLVSYDELIKRRRLPLTTKVSDVLVHPARVDVEHTMPEVAKLMVNSGHRSLPVVDDDDRLKGLIRRHDIITKAWKSGLFKDTKVSDIMSELPKVVNEKESIITAQNAMRQLSIRSIPVVDRNGRVSGFIGTTDIANYLFVPRHRERSGEAAGEKKPVKIKVDSVMDAPAIMISPDATVQKAMKLMSENEISTLAVVDNDNKPLGVLTQLDIIEAISTLVPEDIIPIQITGMDFAEPMVASGIYDIAKACVKKVDRMFKVRQFSMHISEHHSKGIEHEGVYELRARLYTDKKMYYAAREGYEPIALMNEIFDILESQVKKDHSKALDARKTRRRQ